MKLPPSEKPPLGLGKAAAFGIVGILVFHIAYAWSLGPLMVVFLWCLLNLAALATARKAFYSGLTIGFLIYAPQLGFFWSLFGFPAVALWLVLASWIGLFTLLCHLCRRRLGSLWAALFAPFVWIGLEFFRCELYHLRFAWLNVGLAFTFGPHQALAGALGVYGIGFVVALVASFCSLLPQRRLVAIGVIGLLTLALPGPTTPVPPRGDGTIRVAGVQVEFPAELEVPGLLDEALRRCPEADLVMLSEYAFDGPVPERVKRWCRDNARYLVAGGKESVGCSEFRNTAFVVGPSGEVIFKQAKCVPIQFFKDGIRADEQRLWDSPWGKLGICICYDLSYSRVTDALISQGAQALLVPTMDLMDLGGHEHRIHARVAPMRASEYGIPIFRLSSSGISQLVDGRGKVRRSTAFPEQGAILAGELTLSCRGRLPLDRYLAPGCSGLTAVMAALLFAPGLKFRRGAGNAPSSRFDALPDIPRWGVRRPRTGPRTAWLVQG